MNPEVRLRRPAAAAVLRHMGLRVTTGTLSVMGSYETGPVYVRNGKFAEYRVADLEEFARRKLARQAAKREGGGMTSTT